MRISKTTTRFASALVIALMAAEPSSAACTRLAFSVNDYGKDGPIKDAKKLLDTYIAKWTAERGIKTYRTGKKDVNCELFLDVIVFDEHTCKAEATVCWDGPPVAGPIQAATPSPAQATPAAQPGVAIKKPATPRPVTAAAPVASKPAVIETGTVSGVAIVPTAPVASPKASPPADTTAPVKPIVAAPAPKVESATVKAADQVTEQALQAAQRAAAAAERAAAAAERAAAAAAAAERGPVKAQ